MISNQNGRSLTSELGGNCKPCKPSLQYEDLHSNIRSHWGLEFYLCFSQNQREDNETENPSSNECPMLCFPVTISKR